MSSKSVQKRIEIQKQATDEDIVFEVLGHVGRILNGSKSAPAGHFRFWNANVYVDKVDHTDAIKVWFGDIDLKDDADKLRELARRLGRRVFVTKEMPYRFETVTVTRLESESVAANEKGTYGPHTVAVEFCPEREEDR
jgi:hypothetical protein